MKKIISLALVFILVVSMGSFTFAKPSQGWDKWSDEEYDEYNGFIPPGLQGKGLPPGLAKKDKIPNGWNKGEKHQWKEQNRAIEDLEQLVTKVNNYLEDLEENHEDFYEMYDDEDEVIYEILEILGDIDGLNEPTQEELNELYKDLDDKLDTLKALKKEYDKERKFNYALEDTDMILNYMVEEEDTTTDQATSIGAIQVDIADLLAEEDNIVTDLEYEGILEAIGEVEGFDNILVNFVDRVNVYIENDLKNNYSSDALDAVEDKIETFYDTGDNFVVNEDDADEAYIELYWLVKDLEKDYDDALEFNFALEEADMILDYMVEEEDTTTDQATSIGAIQADIDGLLADEDDIVTDLEYGDILDAIDDVDDFNNILENFVDRVNDYIDVLDSDYVDGNPTALEAVNDKIDELAVLTEEESDEEYFELYRLFKVLEEDYDNFSG